MHQAEVLHHNILTSELENIIIIIIKVNWTKFHLEGFKSVTFLTRHKPSLAGRSNPPIN